MNLPASQYQARRKTLLGLIPLFLLILAIVGTVMSMGKIREMFVGASGENANIVVDTQAIIGPLPRPWRNLSQGGEEAGWRIKPIMGQVKALHPEYIRIDHVFDFYIGVSRDGGKLAYDWTKADAIISDILAAGAKPYLALSYTPSALSVNGDITGVPTNWGEYQQVIRTTIEHFSKGRGIENMMYEVWNEPDLFGGWKIGGAKDYLTMYASASNAAKQAAAAGAKPFQIGGPATTDLYDNWINSLLTFAEQKDLRLDFITWHKYDRDVDAYKKEIAHVQDLIAEHPKFSSTEFQITEWGHDPKNDAGYDSSYSAAHTVAVATELIGIIKRAFVFEIQDGKSSDGKQYWGRWGLLTHNDVGVKQKPRYNALRLLDRLADQRLQLLGRGSWVKGAASTDGTKITVILANYDRHGSHGETVPVTFTNVTSENFQLTVEYLDGTKKISNATASDGAIKVEVPMQANAVALLQLSPL